MFPAMEGSSLHLLHENHSVLDACKAVGLWPVPQGETLGFRLLIILRVGDQRSLPV